jgi:NitT/TauT family transport system ATP-binding protein
VPDVTTHSSPGSASTATPGTSPPIIVGREVTKRFVRGNVLAVDSASFHVERGEFISIVGPSGCGKSTLLRMVAGLIPLSAGSLQIHGEDVTGPRPDAAMMFQQATLLPWKTALQNVILPLKLRGRVGTAEQDKARGLLGMLGLGDFESAYPPHLSGGMQQRVALARTLVTGAGLLLMDEPFAALDEFTRERLNLELLRIQHELGATILFVTHNISEAVFLADRVFVMTPRPGRLAAVIDVDLPDERTIDVMRSQTFTDTAFQVRELLNDAG